VVFEWGRYYTYSKSYENEKDGKTGRVNFNSIPSDFFETGIIYKKLELDFFESIRFPASRDINYYGYRQPKSKADMFGIKIGIRFN